MDSGGRKEFPQGQTPGPSGDLKSKLKLRLPLEGLPRWLSVAHDEIRFTGWRLVLQRIHGLQHQVVIARWKVLQLDLHPKGNHGIALLNEIVHSLGAGG